MIYRALFQAVLRWLPPNFAHRLAAATLRLVTRPTALARLLRRRSYPRGAGGAALSVQALGRKFPTPLGAAAGIDKEADWFAALGTIGFGCVEIGTVTPAPQTPNPGPTMARIVNERGLLNRMGFPNPGVEVIAARLSARRDPTIVGANIGKQRETPLEQAPEDYRMLAARLAPLADYIAVNVSSPNTAGLRELGSVARLEPLLAAVKSAISETAPGTPLLVKVSPDMSDTDLDAVADLARKLALDGIIATNTTVDRAVLSGPQPWAVRRIDGGGISGGPLKDRSLTVLARLYKRSEGALTLISVGGVESVDDIWERIAHGATLVQAYTGFVYGGPAWPGRINRALTRRLRASGRSSIQSLVGAAVDR